MTTHNKTFNDFIRYRWETFYKPIALLIFIVAIIVGVALGLIYGVQHGWVFLTTINPNILRIGLPIFAVVVIFVGIEYHAYTKFISQTTPFIPEYKNTD